MSVCVCVFVSRQTVFITLFHILQLVGSNPVMYVNEQSVCDLREKKMVICAKNVRLELSLDIFMHHYLSVGDTIKSLHA